MGQKIHPTGFRLSVTRNWTSRWYSNSKTFPQMLKEDLEVRDYLKKKAGTRISRPRRHRATGQERKGDGL